MKHFCSLLVALTILMGPVYAQRAKKPWLRPTRTIKPYSVRYFPALKWRVTLGMARDTTPVIADLDLDGSQDILVPSVNGNSLYRLTDNGEVEWVVEMGAKATAGIALGDVNRDGSLEILATYEDTLVCLDAAGKTLWEYKIPAEGDEKTEINSQPAIADIDGDGAPEIVFGANDNRIHVLSGNGRWKWTYKTKSWITGGVALGNLTGDGKLEIVFGSMDYNVYCLSSSGKLLWKYAAYDWVQAPPVVADVDKDGELDVLALADDGWLYCLSRLGTLKWKERVIQAQHMKPYLAVADLDGDGTREIIVATPDGNLQVFTAFGDRAWSAYSNGPALAAPLVVDLDGDGWQDILVATTSGQFLAFDSWGRMQWSHNLGQTIEATPAIADADKDGKWEIYVANLMGQERDSGFFSQFEISVNGGTSAWPALKGDPYRTNGLTNARDYGNALKRGGDYATAWEPFFGGSRPRSTLQAPRRLKVTALPLEDVRGNRDGALDPGETALFKVRVQNLGKGVSYQTLLSADLGDSPLKLDRTRTYLGRLAPGASKTVTYRLTAPPLHELLAMLQTEQANAFRDVAAPPPLVPAASDALKLPVPKPRKQAASGWQSARLRVTEGGSLAALSVAKVFNVPPLPPSLRIITRSLRDSVTTLTYGNGNRSLESGETVVLRLLLRNDGLSTARTATATLSSPSSDVLVATPAAMMTGVVPRGGRQVQFSLRVARQVKNKEVVLNLRTEVPTGLGAVVTENQKIRLSLKQGGLDTQAPHFTLKSPAARIASTRRAEIVLSGEVDDATDIAAFSMAKVSIDKKQLKKLGPNRYQFTLRKALRVGENVVALGATDGAGNTSTMWVRIIRKP